MGNKHIIWYESKWAKIQFNFLMTETTLQHVSMSKLSCTSFIFTNGTNIFTSGTCTIGATGWWYYSGFYGNQRHQWKNHKWCHWENPEHSLRVIKLMLKGNCLFVSLERWRVFRTSEGIQNKRGYSGQVRVFRTREGIQDKWGYSGQVRVFRTREGIQDKWGYSG